MLKIIIIISLLLTSSLFAKELEKVSLQLEWKHQFEFAGYYMAKEKGFYKDVNLDVEIKEFKSKTNIVKDVEDTISTFGVSYPSIVLDKSRGSNIVILNAIFQSSPHVLVTLKSSNINSIKDFKNKKIMMNAWESQSAPFISMLHSNHISLDDMTIVEHNFNIQDLIDKKVDITTAFSSNGLYTLDKLEIEYNIWKPKDHGFDFYEGLLFTSNKVLIDDKDMVIDFQKASLRGWEYAFSHITESVNIIYEKYNTQNKTKEALVYEAKKLKEFAYLNIEKVGKIEKNRIQTIYNTYNLLGLTKNKINLDDFILSQNAYSTILTQKENEYLKEKKQITMCIDPAWMPFEEFNENKKHVGMTADYYDIFRDKLKIDIQPIFTTSWDETLEFAKDRKCDILSLAMQTPKRKKYLNFTTPYLKIPLVIATKLDIPFINDIESIKDKKVGITKGYAFIEVLKSKYPNLNIVEVKNIEEGLKKVNSGVLFGYIGTLATVSHSFQSGYSGELKIAGKFSENWELGIGVRDDDIVLLNILQKVVNSLEAKEQQKILNDWISIKYVKGVDYRLLWQIVIIFTLILVIASIFYAKQRKLNKIILKQKDEFEAIFNEGKDAIIILDMDLNFLDVNPAYLEMTGFIKDELLKTPYLNSTAPKDVDETKKALQEVIKVGFIKNFEKETLLKDDKYIIVNMSISLLHSPNRILITSRDVTKDKIAQLITEKKAYIDTLTQVYNRNKFDEIFEWELKDAKRYKNSLSIAIIDIDKFKDFNDTFGHLIGDEVLINMAQTIDKNLRETDTFARWGGEEFVILFKHTTFESARFVAEKLKDKIEENTHPVAGKITASFGITQYKGGDTLETMFKRCDDALYKAKRNGRNRVEVL